MKGINTLIFLLFIVILSSCRTKKSERIIVNKSDTELSSVKLKKVIKQIKNDSIVFELDRYFIYFIDSKYKCWKTIKIMDKTNNRIHLLATDNVLCFEENGIHNFSPNQKYLLLHSIEKGILYTGIDSIEVEKYYCIFLDIENRKLSGRNYGLFCGGQWSSSNEWILDEEEKYNAIDLFNE